MSTEVKKEIELEIAHVLFSDIVGYSKLLINGQRALRDTLTQIVRNTKGFRTADADGKLIKIPTGDGMALVFHKSPEEPVECALEISRALKEHPNLHLRMGVHSGPVSGMIDVNGQASVAGAGINMAQRVMDCGDAGHILLSKRVADDLEQFPQWRSNLHDLGDCEVKHGVRLHLVNLYTEELGNPDVPEKLKGASAAAVSATARSPRSLKYILIGGALVAAVALGFLLLRMVEPDRQTVPSNTDKAGRGSAESLPIPEKSIAVLPFENLSSDKQNAYFADGIQDEILTRLSKIADLKVISRTSTQRYKSAPENLREIARQLGVAHVLEGSVQKSGDTVRVNVQLIKATTDSHVWADIFDRKLTDILSVESEVAKAIAEQLRAQLSGREEQVIAAKPTDNVEAYDAYLRGLAYSLKPSTPANLLDAQKYFREAVHLDPKFALSWALLSLVDARLYRRPDFQPTVALREETRQAAETALTLQPNLAEAILAKGYYHYSCLQDYDNAVRYYEQARQLLPNSSQIPESLAYVMRRRGQWDRSESYFNQAERLNPRDLNLLSQHALYYIACRRFPEALRKLDQILDLAPDNVDMLLTKAAIAQAEGDLPRASTILASLQSAAVSPGVLGVQVYQVILERRPGPIIVRLQEILTKPDPALGAESSGLRFFLGWAQEITGNHAAAEKSWRQAHSELESFLKDEPANYNLIGDLALTNVRLGDKAGALALAARMMTMISIEKDAVDGPYPIEVFARVAAQAGESDRAIAALEKILSIPYSGMAGGMPLTPALLRLDPMFDSLRSDPRFQKLAAPPAPKDTKP